ncbi:polyprenyl synthetase family protein [Capillibacterium thermochitinicola]|uniref:Polyprenyl synthetase family protein n=1 Tax=Capillibacterium thermochitinicola TaxID=2699427 RepID=A0A8J6I203_9FIRM|nr:polyprenyl synthetase family protein [Capillibacterium thermochitinicola]MBA2133523.1 polyprenyl synthetase family protein [Capillibacterium thermochitinicola]
MRGLDRFDPGTALFPDDVDGMMTPLKKIIKELFATPGKGLRGELLMLCAGGPPLATGSSTLNALVLGVEVLHLATLVHDDLLDQGEQRRGRPTVWKKWGVKTAVLVGDYLFAAAYRLLSSACGQEGMERVDFLLREMVAGELAEEIDKFRIISIDRYLERIERKTARFFQIVCELGGEYAALPRAVQVELGAFGRELGMAYQLFDDWQDLSGGAKEDGKPVFQDLKNGVLTLPLLIISGQPGFAEVLAEVRAEGKVLPKHRRLIRKWLTAAQVEAEVEQRIAGYRRRAEERLAGLGLPQCALLRDYADRFFERKGKQKRLSTVH